MKRFSHFGARFFLVMAAALAIVIAGCSKREKYPLGEAGGMLTIGSLNEPASLNPLLLSFTAPSDIQEKLFLSLHRFDKSMNIVPELAESWKFSEDFREVTYHLRQDVKWSDGQPVTAEDVKYTFDLMTDPQVNYSRAGYLQFVETVEVINAYAVRFKFNRLYSDELFDTGIIVLPKHALEKQASLASGEFDASPVTDGPYQVEQWIRGDRLVLTANPGFYKGQPALEQIVIRFFGDEASLAAALQNGEVDMTEDLSPQSILKLQGDPNLVAIDYPGRSYAYLGWNLKSPLFASAQLRKAFAMAIDPSEIIQSVLLGKGQAAAGPILPSSWAYDENLKPMPYDPEIVKSALSDLGWKSLNRDGFLAKNPRQALQINLLLAQGQPVLEASAAIIQKQMKMAGVKVNVQVADARTFIQRIRTGAYDVMMFSWKNDLKVDPTAVWHSKVENKGIFNLLEYSNPQVDSLIDQGLGTLSRRKAKDIWVKFQQVVAQEQPATYLFVPNAVAMVYKGVKGAQSDARGPLASLDEWWIPSAERRGAQVAAVTPPAPETPAPVTTPEPETPASTPVTNKPAPAAPKPVPVKPAPAPKPVNPQDILVAETPTPAATPAPVAAAPEPVAEIPPTDPEPTNIGKAEYPDLARKAGITGRVFVKVIVGADGKVKSAEVLRGIGGGCDEAAMEAAKKSNFKPGTVNGQPAERSFTIPYSFR
ncbi:TonB family protein [candidate division TA06 bacterium]|uniref:TonB family protein n=1 Tax=candidate division TA06 bacterium TaxID=2250710 RepID=A0A933IBM3_UNCT6|nr:TonB family protein [candidate division TA06 bacterium]